MAPGSNNGPKPWPFPTPLILLLSAYFLLPPMPAGATRVGHVSFQTACITRPHPPPVCTGAVRRVIVIGAGMSGVSAAHNLTMTNPCFKVVVLEARSRVGGRMYSRTEQVPGLGTVRAEMGGQWIQSWVGNPITALANKYKLRIGAQNDAQTQYSDAGREYSDAELNRAEAQYQALMAKTLRYAGGLDTDISVDAAFRHVNAALYLTPYVQCRVAQDFEFEFGGLDTLSATYYEDDAFGGGDVLVLDGYDSIPKLLLGDAQAAGAELHLNATVTAVTVSQGAVTVTVTGTTVGAGKAKGKADASTVTYTGDAVIVTVPLGVLKAGVIQFQPQLSARKRGAIARLGFGFGTKVVSFFQTRFWDLSADEYGVNDADVPAQRGRFPDWRNLAHPENQSALMGYALGEYAHSMGGNSTGLIDDAHAKIRLMFPAAKLPENQPLATWVQDWGADPFARGMYSFAQVGVEGNSQGTTDYDKLTEPEGILFFAGEHTSKAYRASVHGAYLSGQRAAGQVAAYFQ